MTNYMYENEKAGGVGGGLKDLAENHGYIKQKSYKGGCFTHE